MAGDITFSPQSLILALIALPFSFFLVRFAPVPGSRRPFDVVVGVLSARHHFDERQSLRDSWFGYAQSHDRLMVKFIVGSKECSIHPDYRKSSYGCAPSNMSSENIHHEVTAVNLGETIQDKEVNISLPDKISFEVHHPIIVKKLGLHCALSSSSLLTSSFMVYLYDDVNEESVVQVSFTSSSPGVRVGDYLFKPVESFILPKDFQASVIVKALDEDGGWLPAPTKSISLRTGGNVISYFQNHWSNSLQENLSFYHEELPQTFPGNFMFVIHGSEELLVNLEQRDDKNKEWLAERSQVQKKLEDEIDQHGDIHLVETIDTYENLPLKVLLFHKWLSEAVNFRYFLKTDDDCFLNIESILKILDKESFPKAHVWWGNFRYNWAVERHGKWAERSYPSTAYPAFACGSGNVLSSDLVKWIAQNYGALHQYQGEDVSVAIWLSAVLPKYLDDKRWICDEECDPNMLASAEHSEAEIKQLWSNWTECDNPCRCYS